MEFKPVEGPTKILNSLKAWFTWSFLANFGTHPIFKLTVLSPFLAQVLIYEESVKNVLVNYLNWEQLKWMYWSLISLSVGQIAFSLRCPKEIKQFPTEERYIPGIINSASDNDIEALLFNKIKLFFKNYDGVLQIDSERLSEVRIKLNLNEIKAARNGEVLNEIEQTSLVTGYWNAVSNLSKSLEDNEYYGFNWNVLGSVLTHHKDVFMPDRHCEKQKQSFDELLEVISEAGHNPQWKIPILKEQYQRLDFRNKLSRMACFFLYAFGMFYFLFHGLRLVLCVLEPNICNNCTVTVIT